MRRFKITISVALLVAIFSGCGKENLTPNTGTVTAPYNSVLRFAANNNNLYTISAKTDFIYTYSINSFSITNAADPSFNRTSPVSSVAYTIYTNANSLFIDTQTGLEVYDIANGAGPNYLGKYSAYRSCNPIVFNDKFAFESVRSGASCSTGPSQVNVIDIATDPKLPKLLYSYPMTQPFGLAVDGNYLFVCDEGLKLYDISTPATPLLKQKIVTSATGVVAQNGKLIVSAADGLSQYDYSTGTLIFLSKLPNR